MRSAFDVIRAAIPGADDDLCEHVLWSRTPFPIEAPDARSLYRAADRVQRAARSGRRLCDFCDRDAAGRWCCDGCAAALGGRGAAVSEAGVAR